MSKSYLQYHLQPLTSLFHPHHKIILRYTLLSLRFTKIECKTKCIVWCGSSLIAYFCPRDFLLNDLCQFHPSLNIANSPTLLIVFHSFRYPNYSRWRISTLRNNANRLSLFLLSRVYAPLSVTVTVSHIYPSV